MRGQRLNYLWMWKWKIDKAQDGNRDNVMNLNLERKSQHGIQACLELYLQKKL